MRVEKMSAGRGGWWPVVLLLILFVARVEHAASVKTMTSDEVLHISQGMALVEQGDARLQPENGIWSQRMIGWGVVALAAHSPLLRLPAQLAGDNQRWGEASMLLYRAGQDHHQLVWAGRQASIFCGLALCLVVYGWSRQLWGQAGGFLSLFLVSMSPDVLAHSALATSDVPLWCFSLLALWCGWRAMLKPEMLRVLLAGLSLGAAITAKLNGIMLVPILGLLPFVAMFDSRPGIRARALVSAMGALALTCVLAYATVWAMYGFRFASALPPAMIDPGMFVPERLGVMRHWLLAHRLLPESYLWGMQYVLENASNRGSFLAGQVSAQGSLSYFPLALAWKTPIGLIVLWALGLGVGVRALAKSGEGRRRTVDLAPLLVFCVAFLLLALTARIHIGVRHVIPAVLPWFVLVGGVTHAFARRKWIVVLLSGLMAVESLWIHPHYLAFFNALAGGPARGYRLLVDSNLDWGQDLDALVEWSQRLPSGEPLYYAYFGTALPERHGLHGIALREHAGMSSVTSRAIRLGPGVYAVSATLLPNMLGAGDDSGPWRARLELPYRALRTKLASGVVLTRDETALFNFLTFSRLTQWLRAREPDETIHYSILIYRLDQAAVERILDGPLPP